MQKYVYEITKNLTREELIEEFSKINYVNPKKEEIMETYGFKTDNINLNEIEATIEVNQDKKNIERILSVTDFAVILNDFGIHNYEKDKENFLKLLDRIKINLEDEDILIFCKCIVEIKRYKFVLEELNNTKIITSEVLENILNKIRVEANPKVINGLQKYIESIKNQQAIYLPILREKYYDENDVVSYSVKVEVPEDNETSLISFKGQLFEKLDFKSNEEALKFALDNNIEHELDDEVTSYFHFEGDEVIKNWVKEIEIKKQKNTIIVWYGDPFILVNDTKGPITPKEIDLVIREIINNTPINEFSKYVLKELRGLKKAIELRKGYIRSEEDIINKKALEKTSSILADPEYGNERNISLRAKIISETPLEKIKDKQKKLGF